MVAKHRNLAESLRNIRAKRNLTLEEFSKELDIPKTTLQSILADGQTTLYTAIHISEKLGIPLDILTNGALSSNAVEWLDSFFAQLKWYDRLSIEKKHEARNHMIALIRIMEEEDYSPYSDTNENEI